MDKLLTVEEAAEALRVTVVTVQRYIRAGKLPAAKLGKAWRISERDLEEFVAWAKLTDAAQHVLRTVQTFPRLRTLEWTATQDGAVAMAAGLPVKLVYLPTERFWSGYIGEKHYGSSSASIPLWLDHQLKAVGIEPATAEEPPNAE